MENPVASLLRATLSALDFAVLRHGFAPHGRDYVFLIQDGLGSHELTLTHVVHFRYETRVRDAVWLQSWSDEFLNYEVWRSAGEPDGYIWGTEWSLAYPGISLPTTSEEAEEWSRRLHRPMHPFLIETDRFLINLVFSDVHFVKQSNDTSLIQRVIIPG
ncbi:MULTISPECIES: YxiG-like protein [unclassified Inquilinus]|uniref:YxiG-like protein n=1 Tax=unclassified Inquilinus TaxID=2645927 RepID=UPI003F8ECA70